MKRISAINILSGLVFAIGFLTIIGWLFHIPTFVSILPNYYNMAFNTALCFMVVGLTLLVQDNKYISNKIVFLTGGSILIALPSLVLSQFIFRYSLGIDAFFMQPWLLEHNPMPGRMAINTCVCFILTGLTFILLTNLKNKTSAVVLQISVILVGAIGVSVLLGYLVGFEVLSSWFNFTKMAIHTAIGFVLTSIVLWKIWHDTAFYKAFYENKDDKKILALSMVILVGVASISGLLGFVISAKQDQITIQHFLQESLKDKTDLIHDLMYKSMVEINIFEKPQVLKMILNKNSIDTLSNIFLNTTFSGVKIEEINNRILYREGDFVDYPQGAISLNLPYQARVIWNNAFYLQMTTKVSNSIVKLQWPLGNLLQNTRDNTNTVNKEFYFCYMNAKQLACLPPTNSATTIIQDFSPRVIKSLGNAVSNNKVLTITNLSSSEAKMLLAYRPIDEWKAGILVKTDLTAVYKPIVYRSILAIFILVITVISGAMLLYLMVSPLVNKVKESEAQFRVAFDSSAIGMALVSLNGHFVRVNNALCSILHYSEAELTQLSVTNIVHPDDSQSLFAAVKESIKNNIEGFRLETRFFDRSSQIIWILLNATLIRDAMNKPIHFVCQIQDITKQREYEDQLNYQARHDALTGLVNRAELEEKLNQIINISQRANKKFSVFFLDLDDFKQVNDSLGHDAGDRLLKTIAERLQGCVRKGDVVARLGGDEFVLVLTDIHDYKTAAIFADRVITIMLSPTKIKGHDIFATSSIGISFYPNDGGDAVTLIKNADQALYRAKNSGRNNYQFCEEDASSQVRAKMTFESDLKKAIDNNEFRMCYLPLIDPTYKSVVGVEGLLRWQSQQYGLVTPQHIIPIAEETGLIIPLSDWILKTACEQVKEWQQTKFNQLHLSINISARHYMHEGVINSIIDNLQLTKFDPMLLMLEINENLIMQDPKKTLEIISMLKRYGINIVIDNFGTGYSSLTYLQDFDVDAIKIDKSLVKEISQNKKREELIIAVVKFAKDLGIRVIAEGVENKGQFEFLINAGCDELQGYYISKPLLAEELTKYLDSNTHAKI